MRNESTGKFPERVWRRLRNLRRDESGAIMLETVLVFPIQLLLTLFIIQSALIWSAANIINYAAFQTARTAMVELRGPDFTAAAARRSWQAAYTVTSVLANPIKKESERRYAYTLRTLHHNYYMPKHHGLGNSSGLEVYIGRERSRIDSPDDDLITAAVRYYFPLTVPVAGSLIGVAYPGNVLNNIRFIPMEQVVTLPKPWPY